ncbi:glycosyltransferase family 9 protein [Nonlabens ponticola]|uniref:Lipopolysaccharide heptosyltransferase family protein n=1 Tax=Nonlabens ponticola TaxID=2496866 RepID=A0A3S9MVB4_9FLAO|nr:glycosyltransferase family 9 protein [Nonlabens ponticola]AZQ43108.1 lipopolysaccharide heptosyltransferase family protein [Nonlabens ponticola]
MSLPQRILVMRLSAMGDVAIVVPVLLAMREQYPDVEIIMLSRKRFLPILNQVQGIVLEEIDTAGDHKGILGLRRLAKTLRAYEVDAIADIHDVLRTKLLRFFLFKTQAAVIDKGRNDKKKLISMSDFFKQLPLTVDRYIKVFDNLGFKFELNGKHVLPKSSVPDNIQQILGSHKQKWIGFAPFAAHASKSLTLTKTQEIVHELSLLDNVQILLFGGGEKECQWLKIAAGTHASVFNLAGMMSLEEELQVISNLDTMICVDSGNGHLAAMYGVPVITLWGNTHPYAGFKPINQPEENQIIVSRDKYPKMPTTIYGKKVPADYVEALDSIDTSVIIKRLEAILRK